MWQYSKRFLYNHILCKYVVYNPLFVFFWILAIDKGHYKSSQFSILVLLKTMVNCPQKPQKDKILRYDGFIGDWFNLWCVQNYWHVFKLQTVWYLYYFVLILIKSIKEFIYFFHFINELFNRKLVQKIVKIFPRAFLHYI